MLPPVAAGRGAVVAGWAVAGAGARAARTAGGAGSFGSADDSSAGMGGGTDVTAGLPMDGGRDSMLAGVDACGDGLPQSFSHGFLGTDSEFPPQSFSHGFVIRKLP